MAFREHPAAPLSALGGDTGLHQVEVGGRKILLARRGEDVFAMGALCPHAQAPLVEGAVCGHRIVCPWHQSVFDLRDGRLLEPPALDGLPSYPVRVADGQVFVTLSDEDDPPPTPPASVPSLGDQATVAIIGAGAAGQAAAEALRAEGFGGRVVMIGREEFPPYDRTNLSKMFLSGQAERDQLPLRPDADAFFASLGVDRRVGVVTRLDAPAKTLAFADGSTLRYTGALLAAGAEPTRLDVPGADLEGVHVLRTLADAEAILARAERAKRAVVIGASFIGLEAASALRERKLAVTVIAPEGEPFAKILGEQVGRSLRAWHEEHGVEFRLGAEVAAIEGEGAVAAVRLKDGTRIEADLVVVGIGVRPATDFVHGVSRAKDGGIEVDERLHAGHNLYVAGDAATFPLPFLGEGQLVRIEHWRVAMQHGRLAARNLAGRTRTLEESGFVPYFWTYHFGRRYNYVGHAEKLDEIILEGDPEKPPFLAHYVRGGKLRATFGFGREADMAALHELLRLGQAAPAEKLRAGPVAHAREAAELLS